MPKVWKAAKQTCTACFCTCLAMHWDLSRMPMFCDLFDRCQRDVSPTNRAIISGLIIMFASGEWRFYADPTLSLLFAMIVLKSRWCIMCALCICVCASTAFLCNRCHSVPLVKQSGQILMQALPVICKMLHACLFKSPRLIVYSRPSIQKSSLLHWYERGVGGGAL